MSVATDRPAKAAENFVAVGLGVSDLARSEDFYVRVMGMEVQRRITLPHMDEVIVGYPGRTSLVLMHWTDGTGPNYRGNPVKIVFYVPDAIMLIERIRAEGLTIVREAEVSPAFGPTLIGMAEDPDGYIIELLQAQPR
ncbi:MAG: VOC family protein [Phenylobacterium sp.]|nr:VOC family protein [Phenylobacterium sp.]